MDLMDSIQQSGAAIMVFVLAWQMLKRWRI